MEEDQPIDAGEPGDTSAGADTSVPGVSVLVDRLVGIRARIAALQAEELTVLADAQRVGLARMERMGSRESVAREVPLRSIAAELGCAVRASDRTMQRRMDAALVTVEGFPVAVAAMAEGRIGKSHLDAIVEAGGRLTGEGLVEFDRFATEVAAREFPGRLRPMLRLIADRLHPETLRERHARAVTKRGVFVRDLDDDMSEVCALVPTVLARGIHDRLTGMAHTVIAARPTTRPAGGPRTPDSLDTHYAPGVGVETPVDTRGIDEVRADVFADLLLTGLPDAASMDAAGGDGFDRVQAEVQITIPVTVLTGADESCPAVLAGYGPVDPATARRLAGGAGVWTRVMTDPVTAQVLAVDTYRPSRAQRRILKFRDGRCRFPGCCQPVWRCDADHTKDAAKGGVTHVCNLEHLCRRHHVLKHHTAWTVRQLPGGYLEWTSPHGRVYTDSPDHAVHFAPAADPPPF